MPPSGCGMKAAVRFPEFDPGALRLEQRIFSFGRELRHEPLVIFIEPGILARRSALMHSVISAVLPLDLSMQVEYSCVISLSAAASGGGVNNNPNTTSIVPRVARPVILITSCQQRLGREFHCSVNDSTPRCGGRPSHLRDFDAAAVNSGRLRRFGANTGYVRLAAITGSSHSPLTVGIGAPANPHLYCSDVRTLHPELHVVADPRAVPSDGAGSDPEFPTTLQRLPDRSSRYCRRA